VPVFVPNTWSGDVCKKPIRGNLPGCLVSFRFPLKRTTESRLALPLPPPSFPNPSSFPTLFPAVFFAFSYWGGFPHFIGTPYFLLSFWVSCWCQPTFLCCSFFPFLAFFTSNIAGASFFFFFSRPLFVPLVVLMIAFPGLLPESTFGPFFLQSTPLSPLPLCAKQLFFWRP